MLLSKEGIGNNQTHLRSIFSIFLFLSVFVSICQYLSVFVSIFQLLFFLYTHIETWKVGLGPVGEAASPLVIVAQHD